MTHNREKAGSIPVAPTITSCSSVVERILYKGRVVGSFPTRRTNFKFMKWKNGRQNAQYQIFKIFSFWRVDCYLIKIPKNQEIPEHVDKVCGKKHFRLNIRLKGDYSLKCEKKIFDFGFGEFFRPDINKHSSPAGKKDSVIFSVGFVV